MNYGQTIHSVCYYYSAANNFLLILNCSDSAINCQREYEIDARTHQFPNNVFIVADVTTQTERGVVAFITKRCLSASMNSTAGITDQSADQG